MWETGRSGEDPGKIHRSGGLWHSGMLGEEESRESRRIRVRER